MQAFYATYEKVAQPVRQLDNLPFFNIPWGHNIRLIQKLKETQELLWPCGDRIAITIARKKKQRFDAVN
jgi:hypothetical protein